MLPAGIVAAGGRIEHFGMPVDPGNLLLLAHLGKRPVLGLPGCCRSPKLNGFDWVLERLAAGLEVTGRDIMRMGVGGLLTEIPSRPQPRDVAATRPANVPALVLAAGQSRRMGGPNKLLLPVAGQAMVRHVVEAALASNSGAGAGRARASAARGPPGPAWAQGRVSSSTPTTPKASAPRCGPASRRCRPRPKGPWSVSATCHG